MGFNGYDLLYNDGTKEFQSLYSTDEDNYIIFNQESEYNIKVKLNSDGNVLSIIIVVI